MINRVWRVLIVLICLISYGIQTMSQNGSREIAVLEYSGFDDANFNGFIKKLANYQRNTVDLYSWNLIGNFFWENTGSGVQVKMNQLYISPSAHYQLFPIDELLLPDKVSFTLSYLNSGKSAFKFENVPADISSVFNIKELQNVDTEVIQISDFQGNYSEEDLQKFEQFLDYVNLYMADVNKADELLQKIRSINLSISDNFYQSYVDVLYTELFVEKTKKHDYHNTLKLTAYDPKGLIPKLNDLDFRSKLLITSLYEGNTNQQLSDLNSNFFFDLNLQIRNAEKDLDYVDALKLCDIATYFLKQNNWSDHYLQDVYKKRRQIGLRLISNFYSVANTSLSNRVFDLCINYIGLINRWYSDLEIIPDSRLDELESSLYLEMLSHAKGLYNSNDRDSAFELFTKADEVHSKFSLSESIYYTWEEDFYTYAIASEMTDSGSNTPENNYSDCEPLKIEFKKELNRGMMKIQSSDFLGADRVLTQLFSKEKELVDCGYNEVLASEVHGSIHYPVLYQKKLVEIDDLILGEEYDSAIREYFQAGKVYFENQLKSYGLYFISPYEFVQVKRNTSLDLALMEYSLSLGEIELSLQVAHKICNESIASNAVYRQLEILGARCAIRDQNGESGPKKSNYSFSGKYLEHFNKGYEMIHTMN